MKYSVITFGCRVNQADSLAVEEKLRAAGGVSASPELADLVIVNTCSVTATADQGARQTIRRVARDNPGARILVTGCYATRSPDEVAALPNVIAVIPNDEKLDLTTAHRFGNGDGPCGSAIEPGVAGRTAFTLRVQTGCAEPCAYCIIPSTRGSPRSLPPEQVIREIDRVSASGFKEIVLTGVHLGSYGRDLNPPSSLIDLLRAIDAWAGTPERSSSGAGTSTVSRQNERRQLPERAASAPGTSGVSPRNDGREPRERPAPGPGGRRAERDVLFRISSLEPMDCTPDVVDLVQTSPAFAPHFHLPLQHASDRVLAAMRRPYTIEYYASLVDAIRAGIPHASIGTDVIAGFPGEMDDDFEELASYLERSPLTHVHVFPYSDRPGTEASGMNGKVHGAAIRERARRVREIGRRLTDRFHESQLGITHRALTLEDGTLAVTGNYLKVRIPPGRPRNEWVHVAISGTSPLVATVVQPACDDREPTRRQGAAALRDTAAASATQVITRFARARTF